MGIFSYTQKQINQKFAKTFIDYLGGSKVVAEQTATDASTLRFLRSKNFFESAGLGSLDAISDETLLQIAQSFRAGRKAGDFSEFFEYSARINPNFAIRGDYTQIFMDRYSDFIINSAKNEKEKEKWANIFKDSTHANITLSSIVKSFDTFGINDHIIGTILKKSDKVSMRQVMALFNSAKEVSDFYFNNEGAIDHYKDVIQRVMYEDKYKKVEQYAKNAKSDKSQKSKKDDEIKGRSRIFDGTKPEDEKQKKQANDKNEQEPEKIVVMQKTDDKTLSPEILEDLEKMGVDTSELKNLLTKENTVKYYLARKSKASIQDIKDITYVDERIRSIMLAPAFKAYFGIDENKFSETKMSEKQKNLFRVIADPNAKEFPKLLRRAENYSIIVKNILMDSYNNYVNEPDIDFVQLDKFQTELIKQLLSSNALAQTDYNKFVSQFLSCAFEPSVKKELIAFNHFPQYEVKKDSAEKILIDGYVRLSDEIIFIQNAIPVEKVLNNGKYSYDFSNAKFNSAVELETFKDELKRKYGCNVDNFDPNKDIILGNNPILNGLHKASSQNKSEILAKINDSQITRDFIRSDKAYTEAELKKIYEQVPVKNADYSLFKGETFYKNAREEGYNAAQKKYYDLLMQETKNKQQQKEQSEQPTGQQQEEQGQQTQEQSAEEQSAQQQTQEQSAEQKTQAKPAEEQSTQQKTQEQSAEQKTQAKPAEEQSAEQQPEQEKPAEEQQEQKSEQPKNNPKPKKTESKNENAKNVTENQTPRTPRKPRKPRKPRVKTTQVAEVKVENCAVEAGVPKEENLSAEGVHIKNHSENKGDKKMTNQISVDQDFYAYKFTVMQRVYSMQFNKNPVNEMLDELQTVENFNSLKMFILNRPYVITKDDPLYNEIFELADKEQNREIEDEDKYSLYNYL